MINPYYLILKELYNRVRWDLTLASITSRRKLRNEHNKYLGKKAVILCNGPSLLETDFASLKDTFCIGLNKINLLFDKNDFRPSCIVSVNKLVLEQNKGFFNQTDIPLYLSHKAVSFIRSRRNVNFLHTLVYPSVPFAQNVKLSVNEGYTVTFVALQLAFHLGFKEVALVGCDHNFAVSGPSNKEVVSEEDDKSHFDPNYFGKGVKWQLPDLVSSEYFYAKAQENYELASRKIFNATIGGKLEVFERKSLESFLSS